MSRPEETRIQSLVSTALAANVFYKLALENVDKSISLKMDLALFPSL